MVVVIQLNCSVDMDGLSSAYMDSETDDKSFGIIHCVSTVLWLLFVYHLVALCMTVEIF